MKIISGQIIADKILQELAQEIESSFIKPGLTVVLVGDDEPSEVYVRLKKQAAEKIGMRFELKRFDVSASQQEVVDCIQELNNRPEVNGIIVQLPLPENFVTDEVVSAIDYRKDADGFTPRSLSDFNEGKFSNWPVFPKAILEMIKSTGKSLEGKKATVVANSEIFGQTMAKVLATEKIETQVILIKDFSTSLKEIKESDIVISAIGQPNLISGSMLKDGAIMIDGGITKIENKVTGDVDVQSVENKDIFLSPVPGGVGPVTIACLLKNVLALTKK